MHSVDHSAHHISPSYLGLSSIIQGLKISPISWENFKGTPDLKASFHAYILWKVNYDLKNLPEDGYSISIKTSLSSKSWYRPQKSSFQLLFHEYGHYLIGCLCALEFKRRATIKIGSCKSFRDYELKKLLKQVFKQTLMQYLAQQVKYDQETNHMKNNEQQAKWINNITKKLLAFQPNCHIPKTPNTRSRKSCRRQAKDKKPKKQHQLKI